MTAEEIIALLDLQPHPEGGFFRETFRDDLANAGSALSGEQANSNGQADRAMSTAIYFLLTAEKGSHWHRVDAVEMWHWYAGAPLELGLAEPSQPERTVVLGADLAAGERPQAVVPRDVWPRARTLGEYSLVGCTVAPGFSFDGFELAPPNWTPPG
ncbi:MAG: cupin domain-containing protein [Pseudomonadota bacterium]